MRTKEEVEKLVEENIWLVSYIMNRYYGIGISIHNELRDDIYQEGSIGLFKAAQKYDINKGIKFTTYASKSIKNTINKYFDRYIYKHYKTDTTSLETCIYHSYGDNTELTINNFIEVEEAGFVEIEVQSVIDGSDEHIKDIEKIAKLRVKGYLQREIAKQLNVSQTEISRRLKLLENRFEKAC